ncbi:MAG: ROK family transcriptional regulator [Spirochaetaceae bacterium]|nr:MAG: ROK family transcriptional regulator [Spirochaetaceae bacterium]
MARLTELTPAQVSVLTLLRRERILTAAQAARHLALSVPTVTARMRSLMDAGLARAAGFARSSGGRRPLRYALEPRGALAVGVAVWPDRIELVTADLDLTPVSSSSRTLRGRMSAARLAATIREVVSSAAAAEPLGVGVSLPGVVDARRAVLTVAPNLFIREMPLSEPGLRLPTMFENEANAAALAETWCHPRPDGTTVVFVSVSQGVGVGIVMDGRLYRGARWRAGEFGHVAVSGGRRRCTCGRTGCWEQYASQTALMRRFHAAVRRRPRPERRFLAHFLEALRLGSPAALESLEWYLDHFSLGLQNVVSCLDPDEIVIGGAVAAIGERLVAGLRQRLDAAPLASPSPRICLSQLGPNAPVLGAAVLQLHRLFG